MSYNLPKKYLSPSQLNTWERCNLQYKIFVVEGAKAPPDCGLEVKKMTHEVILEKDLAQKITSGSNLKPTELQELFVAGLEQKVDLMAEDPNRTDPVEKIVSAEAAYFGKVAVATEPWRRAVEPLAVEQSFEITIGDVPVVGRMDLVQNEKVNDRVVDLKRQGRGPSKGSAQNSRQLATYAIAKNCPDVGLGVIVENVTPKVELENGQISTGLVERVTAQYQAIAGQITDAIEKDRWVPVDTTDNRKSWVCSKLYCGAWGIGSKDWVTGRSIACVFGERAQKKVYGS